MELISSILIWLMDIKTGYAAQVPSPLTLSVIRLSHQLIRPAGFTPLAMFGAAVSPRYTHTHASLGCREKASEMRTRRGPLISAKSAVNQRVEVTVLSAH